MKKYLLSVLALSAMLFVACEPVDDNTDPEPQPEPTPGVQADYVVDSEYMGYVTFWGDYYENGTNNCSIELFAFGFAEDGVTPVSVKDLFIDYNVPASVTDATGELTPDVLDLDLGYSFAPNKYLTGILLEGEAYGTAYVEMDYTTEAYTVQECIVDGPISITLNDGKYTVKGLLTAESGKTVNVDFTGTLEVIDETSGASVYSTRALASPAKAARVFSSVLNKRMIK